jgi:SRSO17 transposase
MSDYSAHFVVWGRDLGKHASDYLSGLLGTERRKNLEGIHGDIPESNYQGIQQFITDSPWKEGELMKQIAREANGILGGHRHSALIIDETTFIKKGERSVGVQRQYCGRLGKTENCQMGVFACLGRGDRSTIVDFRLFLPECWAKDAARCEKAGVPEPDRVHRNKLELALQMVRGARERGLEFRWVLADSAYGSSLDFAREVASEGYLFMLDAAGSTRVWDADPEPIPEARKGTTGRPVSRRRPGNPKAKRTTLETWVKARFAQDARELTIRQTTQGPLRAKVLILEAWLWEPTSAAAEHRTVVAREYEDGKIKISWTNAPAGTSGEELAYMQAQRHWIERSFEDGKSELGLAEYEVRKWRGWHHHMALVSLAMLFVLKERVSHADSAPLLSTRDVVELLRFYLPRKGGTEQEVLDELVRRHEQRRQASIGHANRRRRRRNLVTK